MGISKQSTNTKLDNSLLIELQQAIEKREQAYAQFNHAEPSFIDVAIYEYNAATERVNILIKQVKKKEGEYYDKQINF